MEKASESQDCDCKDGEADHAELGEEKKRHIMHGLVGIAGFVWILCDEFGGVIAGTDAEERMRFEHIPCFSVSCQALGCGSLLVNICCFDRAAEDKGGEDCC